MSDDATLMRQLRAFRRAALQAREEAHLTNRFAPNSYTYGALAQIQLSSCGLRRSSHEITRWPQTALVRCNQLVRGQINERITRLYEQGSRR